MAFRLSFTAFLTALVVTAPTLTAIAADPYDISTATSILPSGTTIGTVVDEQGATAHSDGTGPCTSAEYPEGYPHAQIYSVKASSLQRFLDLDVTDDLAESLSICQVALYQATAAGATLTDPFDASQRAAFLVARAGGCIPDSYCTLETWLKPDLRYFVALWAAPPESVDPNDNPDAVSEATFSYRLRLRRPISISVSVTGHRIRESCNDYHETISGRYFTLKANTSPNTVGSLKFSWYGWNGSTWALIDTNNETLEDGNAYWRIKSASTGKRKLIAKFPGSLTALPATSGSVKVHYVKPAWSRYGDGGLRLKVSMYRQQKRLSCEAAAFRMAHNYHPGYIASDMTVYKVTGIDARRPAVKNGCDPDRAFCGNVDGTMMVDGYGVHDGPMAKAAAHFDKCRPGIKLKGYSYATLAGHINNGYPVVVWGAHRGGSGIYKYNWRAWTGNYVTAYSVEHTWTVVGFHGKPSNPTSFIIHDPSRSSSGGVHKVSPSQLYSFIKYFKTALVVRG